jgi:hypothetical protein
MERPEIEKLNKLVKLAKEEILSTACKEKPSPKVLAPYDFMDKFIENYLFQAFNPAAYIHPRFKPDQAVSFLSHDAEHYKPGAKISEDEVRAILERHVRNTPPDLTPKA